MKNLGEVFSSIFFYVLWIWLNILIKLGIAYNSSRLPTTRSQAAPRGFARPMLAKHRSGLRFPTRAKQFARSIQQHKTKTAQWRFVLVGYSKKSANPFRKKSLTHPLGCGGRRDPL